MAKVSVSIPDALLARAHALHEKDNVSQLVQRALALLAPEKEGQPYRPEWAEARVAVVADRLRAAAREDYEDGYRTGFELAEQAPWDWMVWLDRKKFDVPLLLSILWRAEYQPATDVLRELEMACRSPTGWPPAWHKALGEAFPAEMAPPGVEDCPYRSDQFHAGVKQAFRDVWAYANKSIQQ
ncbi:hypothetical protein [Kitasatospora sp. NPDC059827]|uniref:hypothetical protein n=1 Tax=Kitasatospora sp. NPDC059827 TaxID=3346964 RepID=UPI00364DCFF9